MTKRSLQETVELVIFGLIALIVGLGVLWLVGWVFRLVGTALVWLAAFIWQILGFLLPVVIIAIAVYLLVRFANRGERRPARAEAVTVPPSQPVSVPPPSATPAAPNVSAEAEPAPAERPDEPSEPRRTDEAGEGPKPA